MKLHTKKKSNWSGRTLTAEYRRNREIVRHRDAGSCARCFIVHGIIAIGHEVDHYIPISRGGTDDLGNLILLCRDCHAEKTQRESNGKEGFAERIGLDGWVIEEPDWLEEIAQRNKDRLEGIHI